MDSRKYSRDRDARANGDRPGGSYRRRSPPRGSREDRPRHWNDRVAMDRRYRTPERQSSPERYWRRSPPRRARPEKVLARLDVTAENNMLTIQSTPVGGFSQRLDGNVTFDDCNKATFVEPELPLLYKLAHRYTPFDKAPTRADLDHVVTAMAHEPAARGDVVDYEDAGNCVSSYDVVSFRNNINKICTAWACLSDTWHVGVVRVGLDKEGMVTSVPTDVSRSVIFLDVRDIREESSFFQPEVHYAAFMFEHVCTGGDMDRFKHPLAQAARDRRSYPKYQQCYNGVYSVNVGFESSAGAEVEPLKLLIGAEIDCFDSETGEPLELKTASFKPSSAEPEDIQGWDAGAGITQAALLSVLRSVEAGGHPEDLCRSP
ncbi:MAG: hypothetical protein KVP17_003632 [Porospora cf. gigantea B]|uniref:uncharacterized protein n=1 Tax=Porospora cf. gigantea B TaxID=2853592 RepID=UPI003571E1F6|nr:MAG: hypothetical protein KVP17_003632 [Porospora cf. gigantea B]